MAKIAAVLTNLYEDSEFSEPAKAFEEAGHEVVTIEKKVGNEVTGLNGKKVKVDAGIDDVKAEDFDALFIPGGFSPDQLRADDRFVDFVKPFMENKKPVFAICHGPQLLITAKTLEGRQGTGYKSIRVDLENAGLTYKDEEVVICTGHFVTSRTPDDIPAFNRESLKILEK